METDQLRGGPIRVPSHEYSGHLSSAPVSSPPLEGCLKGERVIETQSLRKDAGERAQSCQGKVERSSEGKGLRVKGRVLGARPRPFPPSPTPWSALAPGLGVSLSVTSKSAAETLELQAQGREPPPPVWRPPPSGSRWSSNCSCGPPGTQCPPRWVTLGVTGDSCASQSAHPSYCTIPGQHERPSYPQGTRATRLWGPTGDPKPGTLGAWGGTRFPTASCSRNIW